MTDILYLTLDWYSLLSFAIVCHSTVCSTFRSILVIYFSWNLHCVKNWRL